MINNNLLNATTEIQSAIRTYMAQQEAQTFLPAIRYLKYSQPKDWKSLPTSLSGTTNVYFPDELPRIVLKDIGNTIHARDRMTNMDLGHRLCKDQGLRSGRAKSALLLQ